jgi:hypothetical protein
MLFKSIDIPENIFGIFEIYKKVIFSSRNNSYRIIPSYPCRTVVWVV